MTGRLLRSGIGRAGVGATPAGRLGISLVSRRCSTSLIWLMRLACRETPERRGRASSAAAGGRRGVRGAGGIRQLEKDEGSEGLEEADTSAAAGGRRGVRGAGGSRHLSSSWRQTTGQRGWRKQTAGGRRGVRGAGGIRQLEVDEGSEGLEESDNKDQLQYWCEEHCCPYYVLSIASPSYPPFPAATPLT